MIDDKSTMNNTPPLISVVMPAYNRELYIGEAIESVLNQTFQDFEFIIIDDGSTDSTFEIIRKYAKLYPKIKFLKNNGNLGGTRSRNRGISIAQGKFIAIMDSDDICLPERFDMQVSYLESHPDIAVLGTNIFVIDENNQILKKSNQLLSPGLIRWGLIFGCPMVHPTVIMHRQVFDFESYSENKPFAEDYDLWVKLSSHYKLQNLPEHLLLYRIHSQRISSIQRQSQIQRNDTHQIMKQYIHHLIGKEITQSQIEGLLNSKNIKTHRTAIELSKLIIKLKKATRNWGLQKAEKEGINEKAAAKLRSIWHARNHDLRLLPFVIYSAILYPQALLKRLLPGKYIK